MLFIDNRTSLSVASLVLRWATLLPICNKLDFFFFHSTLSSWHLHLAKKKKASSTSLMVLFREVWMLTDWHRRGNYSDMRFHTMLLGSCATKLWTETFKSACYKAAVLCIICKTKQPSTCRCNKTYINVNVTQIATNIRCHANSGKSKMDYHDNSRNERLPFCENTYVTGKKQKTLRPCRTEHTENRKVSLGCETTGWVWTGQSELQSFPVAWGKAQRGRSSLLWENKGDQSR